MSGPIVAIREASPDDASLVLSYVRKLAAFEGLESRVSAVESDIRAALTGGRFIRALISYVDGSPAGILVFRNGYSTFSGKPNLYVEDIFVDGNRRGLGVARALFARLADIARSEGCSRLEWSVLDWNEGAMRFYRSMGGEPHAGWQIWKLDLSGQ